jgi:hypothetical protein
VVSVFSGYDENGMQNMLLQAIKTDFDFGILKISEELKTKNYFYFEKDIKEILEKYLNVAEKVLQKDELFYRARKGFKDRKRNISRGFEAEYNYTPYEDMNAPPPNLASNGRVNRTGVSFLYCATNEYTAISEVRPQPEDRVSLCTFSLNKEVKVFDMSDSWLINFFESDKKLDEYRPLNTLGSLLNKTIAPSERIHYNITQLIADCIRQMKFDGILFNSTIGQGKNLVLFDQNLAVQIKGTEKVIVVNSVKYQYQEEVLVNSDDVLTQT